MKLSGAETVFRILCPADNTGGVIGKGGSIVRQFREETGARIRVEDGVPGSDDRVILIVAEGHGRRRKDAGDGGGRGEGDDEDASPAQRALARVFERILRVEEEKSVDGEVAAAGEEKEIRGLVTCRLLAPSSQVGCVLGKGGKIVEKIRQESGAQIRVLSAEQVPACAAPGDELIHISGSFSAVKKALLAVSGCLQDNLKIDAPNFMSSKPLGMTTLGTGSTTHMERFAQRGYPPGLHLADYHPRGYSSNSSIEILPSAQRKVFEEDVLFRMLCTNDKVGSIIGKGGAIVRALQSDTGASIKIVDAISDSEERVIAIAARENSEFQHSPVQDAVLRVHSRIAEAGVEKGAAVSARLLVPSQQIGCLLGKGGNIIAEMRRATGANIRIFLKDYVPKCAQPNDEVVQITGSFQSVQDALRHVTSRIRESIFPLKSPSIGTNQYMSAAHDAPSALSRSRNELSSPSCYSSSGPSHGLDRYSGRAPDWQPPIGHSLEPMGPPPDRLPYFRGSEFSSFDRPCSPRSWAQMVSSGNHGDIPDSGTGLMPRNGGIGSGGQGPVVTSMTVEVVVPYQFLRLVYGENSSNLAQIREFSGAKVTICDPKPGGTEGTVIISGTPDQAHIAQSVLHGFILSGKTAA
uniref:KH domain-containing protein At4g18375 n=1 Tax=Anthurium amnicola TaxID=1678845 RepID=A0A1D1YD91_9ARAE